MAKLSRERVGGVNVHPRENFGNVGVVLGAVNAETIIDCHGCATVALDLRGTFSLTVEVSGTCDGTNWELIPVRSRRGGLYLVAVAGTAAGLWVAECAGYEKVRARVTAYTSGSAVATLIASNAILDQMINGAVTTSLITATAAAGAALTLTLPATGAGLRQYLTYLRIVKFAAAALTAAATPVLVTTTNIPGSLVFSLPADAAAQGSVFTFQEDFSFPLAGTLQNTAMTIVMPVVTGVLWRASAGYYVAA